MPVYGLLLRYLPPWQATVVCALFYAVLIVAILVLLPAAPADFRYGRY